MSAQPPSSPARRGGAGTGAMHCAHQGWGHRDVILITDISDGLVYAVRTRPLPALEKGGATMGILDALKKVGTRETPQSEKILGSDQVMNSAGGFSWQVTDEVRLDRFLILGTEGGS